MGREHEYRYRVVDVFTENPLEGNALAVFPDAASLDATTMQRIALELNLAESAFVLPPTRSDCAARVRIFTPAKEMRFAGHPTIGTAFVLLDEGLVPAHTGGFSLEENIGPVPVRVETGARPMLWLRATSWSCAVPRAATSPSAGGGTWPTPTITWTSSAVVPCPPTGGRLRSTSTR